MYFVMLNLTIYSRSYVPVQSKIHVLLLGTFGDDLVCAVPKYTRFVICLYTRMQDLLYIKVHPLTCLDSIYT